VNAVGNVVPFKIGLTEAQKEARKHGLGGSDAARIVNAINAGRPEEVNRIIQEKRGDIEPVDLSDNVAVFMGHVTEWANLYLLGKKAGLVVTNQGESRVHDEVPWMRNTLDGMTILEKGDPAVVQAKIVDQYARMDEVVEQYMPQIQWEMHVCGVRWGVFSVLFGHRKFGWVTIPKDEAYVRDLIDVMSSVWECIEKRLPWRDMPPPANPELPAIIRRSKPVDMTGNNEWAVAAHSYLLHKPSAEAFKDAEARLKGRKASGKKPAIDALMPHDVREAYGYGVAVIRTADGKLSIREHKESADTLPPSAPIADEIPHFDNFYDLEKMER
jgi:hypothetical protein